MEELAALGLLSERADPDRRNQRTIVFTDRGTRLIADCRAILADLDAHLSNHATAIPGTRPMTQAPSTGANRR